MKKDVIPDAHKKLNVILLKLADESWFQEVVAECRKDLGVPAQGWELQDAIQFDDFLYLPKNLKEQITNGEGTDHRRLNDASREIEKRLPVSSIYLKRVIRLYIFHNEFFFDDVAKCNLYLQESICKLSDVKNDLYEVIPENDFDDLVDCENYQGGS